MKLLLITQIVDRTDANLGFFHTWVDQFSTRFEHITVICLFKGSCKLPENVTVLSLGKEDGASRLLYVLRFFRYVFTTTYDHVFVHMNPEYIVLAGWWWRITGKKILLWYVHKSVNFKLRIAELFATRIFTASKESFRLSSSKVEIVGHGIDTDSFAQRQYTPKQDDKIRLITAGRISQVKDLETVILGFGKVQRKHAELRLDIIGEPITREDIEYKKTLDHLVERLGLEESVRFIGPKAHAEMPQMYAQSHILVHASKTGSVDKVVLEALASGLYVISSSEAYASLDTVISRFEPNDPDSLAQTLEKTLASDIFKPNVLAARVIAEDYSLERFIGRIANYFSHE